jgi:hypothetical protein
MVVMKGNKGKGARRKLLQKLYVVIAILTVTCIVLYRMLHQDDDKDAVTTNGHRNWKLPNALDPRRGLLKNSNVNNLKKKKKPQHRRPPIPSTQRRDAAEIRQRLHPHHGGAAGESELDAEEQAWDDILHARLHLIELHGVGSKPISELTAEFCRLDWQLHKNQPATYPMFRDLVSASEGCGDEDKVFFNFRDVVQAVRTFDEENEGTPTAVNILDLPAVVFHESRCGSTLTANLLATWHPVQHRVYSESTPPLQALQRVCGDSYEKCSVETAAAIFKDVIYLMRRSDDRKEERVFFKFQSAGSRNIEVFQTAFPDTPYLFVYRDPVQVMMSQLGRGVKSANCLQTKGHPSPIIRRILQKYGADKTPEDYCAAHLASITERVMDSYTDYAIPINYRDMPNILFDTVFPQLLDERPIAATDLHRMKEQANVYSKGRGETHEFAADSAQKEAAANERVRAASERYLKSSYDRLEQKAAAVLTTVVTAQQRQRRGQEGGGELYRQHHERLRQPQQAGEDDEGTSGSGEEGAEEI